MVLVTFLTLLLYGFSSFSYPMGCVAVPRFFLFLVVPSVFRPLRRRSVQAYDGFFFPAVPFYCPALNFHLSFHLSCPLVGGGVD
jgi:hypothetical protein